MKPPCLYTVVSILLLRLQEADGVRNLRIVSPLQALTIWDERQVATSPRSRFLPKYEAGLQAETEMKQSLAERRDQQLQVEATSKQWAQDAQAAKNRAQNEEERLLEKAFDSAVAPFEAKEAMTKRVHKKGSKGYQFVGVVNPASQAKPITWYARKKPANSNWSVRLLHVNRDAIIKDLFDQRKIDIFVRYDNTGQVNEETGLPVIQSKYSVRERSWKNLWNFSPKHFFSDSSGMYWRERRLRPGLYTDAKTVYEASYRYRDGRNGMHRVSNFQQFLNSKNVDTKTKQRALERLKKETPDVVLEN